VTGSAFTTAAAWSFGLALTCYLAFAVRVVSASRKNTRARLLLAALVATAGWAACSLLVGFEAQWPSLLAANAADAVRYGAWFLFLWHLLRTQDDAPREGVPVLSPKILVAVAAVLVMSVLLGEAPQYVAVIGPRAAFMLRLGLAVFGLVLVEQIVRRVHPEMRWSIKPLAVALAGVFGLDLFYYADAVLFAKIDPDIWVSRGFANVLVLPFLAIATARNTNWTIDLHLSRGAVIRSSALLASGIFLLAVAGAGYFVRYFGGDWGRALQIELVFAAALLVALVASSGKFRSWLKVFVSKHFFSYRYDYREEWLRFTRTLSTEDGGQTLQVRTVAALAALVESPSGALFVKDESRGFVLSARWNMPPLDALERSDGPLAAFLARTGWIVSIPECRAYPDRYGGLAIPPSIASLPSPSLIVPLISGAELLAFVVLSSPRAVINVDWEVRDLLKTASRQAASYLGHVRATEALLEARKFDAFNRMSAFIVHDLKNLVSELSLMLKNAQRHRDNVEFQADMLTTVEHVVERMNGLMLQLRGESSSVQNPRRLDLGVLAKRVCAAKSDPRVPIALEATPGVVAVAHEDRLERVIGHLLQNAIDASLPAGRVDVCVQGAGPLAIVRVSDNGTGMSPEFIRDRLFKPFQTTKSSGMGIGVYESSQYVAHLGGEIRIESEQGAGTRVEVRLPRTDIEDAASSVSVAREQVA
jgi:putative PEP-CTERM system histidine kinase